MLNIAYVSPPCVYKLAQCTYNISQAQLMAGQAFFYVNFCLTAQAKWWTWSTMVTTDFDGFWWSTMLGHGQPSNTMIKSLSWPWLTMVDHCQNGWPLSTMVVHGWPWSNLIKNSAHHGWPWSTLIIFIQQWSTMDILNAQNLKYLVVY